MSVAVIDYGAGNLYSVLKALNYVEKPPGLNIQLVDSVAPLETATHIVLPGVGSFAGCMGGLTALDGMAEALQRKVLNEKVLFLGICVGMQMLFESSEEHGRHTGLGWLKGHVRKIKVGNEQNYKIPHMGWNALRIKQKNNALLAGIAEGDHAYFVHSYHCVPEDPAMLAATVDYSHEMAAMVHQENIYATQFHPEKSQQTGLLLLQNFLQLQPI